MKDKARLLQWRKGGPRIAFTQPLVGELRSSERQAVLFEEDEGRSAFPSGNCLDQLLRERNPDHEPGFLLRDVDAGTALVFLDVGPAHLHKDAVALPGVRCQGDDARHVWPSTALGELDLFIGPWLIGTSPAWGFRAHRNRMGQEVAHECPFLDRLECRLCVLLLCRPIGEAVKEGLHERRPDNVNRIGSQRVGPLRKAEQVAVANARGLRERIVLRARQIGPNDFGKAATLNVTLSLPHGSPPLPDSTGFGEYTADGGRRYFRELTDEILASRSPGRNRYRRHCHSRSVLCLLGPNGFARVDGDKLCALLVGSR